METCTFEWTFTPADFFEEEHTYSTYGCHVVIRAGRATASTNAAHANSDPNLEVNIRRDLQARFTAAQLDHPKRFWLEPRAAKATIRPDGSTRLEELVDEVRVRIVERVEVIQTDASGNLISHSVVAGKRAELGEWSKLAAKHAGDATASAMLASYQKSVDDPSSLFVRLYEVRDAISSHFGGQQQALSALGLNSNDWSELGQLANHAPIHEGRHIGKNAGQLRDATSAEISVGRRIVADMIRAYLGWLDRQPTVP